MMTASIFVIVYAAVLAFAIACVTRAVGYARLPLHLRWELYPVPHEEKERARHGGSYFELTDWWTKPTHINLLGELRSMASEIFLLRGLWEFRKKMWYRSYPFHLGLYLVSGAAGLLLFTAVLSILFPAFLSSGAAGIIQSAYRATWVAGAILILLGATSLLIYRLTDEQLRPYTVPGDVFNLVLFIATPGLLCCGYLVRPADSPSALALAQGLLTFDTTVKVPGLLATGLIIGGLLLAYIPLTHMSHFIAKYFTYHFVRWDDRASLKDRKLEAKIAEYLTYRPNWGAAHVGGNGLNSWGDIVTSNPTQGGRK
jgi:nitrate reductase gamma subunit